MNETDEDGFETPSYDRDAYDTDEERLVAYMEFNGETIAPYQVSDALQDVAHLEVGTSTVYRMMRMTPKVVASLAAGMPLGIYWSEDPNPDKSQMFADRDAGPWHLIEARVEAAAINLAESAAGRLLFAAEREVRLLPGRTIVLTGITRAGRAVRTDLNGETFTA